MQFDVIFVFVVVLMLVSVIYVITIPCFVNFLVNLLIILRVRIT